MWVNTEPTMSVDRGLTIAGLIVAVLSLLLAYVFYRKTVRTKLLGIGYTAPTPLMVTTEDIALTYMGHSVTSIARVFILLWNKGTSPIEATDFIAPISLTSDTSLLKLDVFDKDATSQISVDSETSTISISLLRPSEAVMLVAEIANDEKRPNLKVEMKSADMITIVRWPPNLIPIIVALLFPVLLFVGFLGLLIYATLTQPYVEPEPVPTLPQIAALIGLFVVFPVTVVFIGKIAVKAAQAICNRLYSPVVMRFSELQGKAWANRQAWKQLRKSLTKKTAT
jgi:hypothetical protein